MSTAGQPVKKLQWLPMHWWVNRPWNCSISELGGGEGGRWSQHHSAHWLNTWNTAVCVTPGIALSMLLDSWIPPCSLISAACNAHILATHFVHPWNSGFFNEIPDREMKTILFVSTLVTCGTPSLRMQCWTVPKRQ